MDTVAINHNFCQEVIDTQREHIARLKRELKEMTAERDKLLKQLEDYYRSIDFVTKCFY